MHQTKVSVIRNPKIHIHHAKRHLCSYLEAYRCSSNQLKLNRALTPSSQLGAYQATGRLWTTFNFAPNSALINAIILFAGQYKDTVVQKNKITYSKFNTPTCSWLEVFTVNPHIYFSREGAEFLIPNRNCDTSRMLHHLSQGDSVPRISSSVIWVVKLGCSWYSLVHFVKSIPVDVSVSSVIRNSLTVRKWICALCDVRLSGPTTLKNSVPITQLQTYFLRSR